MGPIEGEEFVQYEGRLRGLLAQQLLMEVSLKEVSPKEVSLKEVSLVRLLKGLGRLLKDLLRRQSRSHAVA